jgi:hypothetical protein
MRMRHIVSCGLSGSTVFFHIFSQRHDFQKRVFERKMFFFMLPGTSPFQEELREM